MVLAEIPLWVVHPSSSSQDAGPLFGGAAASHRTNAERAQHSLRLLQGRQKCAIYSVDLHPPLMATAGGDGTVRLWNSQALFAHDDDDDEKGGGGGSSVAQYSEQGTYVSSSASSSSEGEENNNNMHHKDTNGGFSSSDSGAENDEQVHDLNAVVRRKKDGSSPQRKQQQQQSRAAAAAAAAAGEAPLSPSRARGGTSGSSSKHHHHHHHRLICTLSAHTGSSVLCVRFSPSGKYLASAGDDAVVCIYTATAAAAAATGPNGNRTAGDQQQQQQHWSRIKLCRGHGLDVVDLAWAPDDSHLVSCSLDSETPIIVWKLTDLVSTAAAAAAAGGVATTTTTLYSSKSILCNPYKILGRDIHTSTVKGVAFDPAGSYLASSGDDPAVCIWRAHDDWGLEKRIDASSGIFRKWRGSSGSTGTTNTTSTKVDSHDVDDVQALSNQSMFRRLSWSTDGAFLCATNAVVKNKHVASTIGREGWSVATNSAEGAVGAATLVGHKQPVVVSRHAAELLNGKKKKKKKKPDDDSDGNEMEVDDNDDDDDDDDSEPESATLLALGDHRGFITVWSTRKSRPLFKLQCSESRCTVTDLAWGRMLDKTTGEKGDMLLLVSLLDGQLVALKFSVPDELGPFLTPKDHRRVFQLRYGIDVEDDGRQLVGRNTGGTRLIENAVQLSLEEANNDKDDEGHFAGGGDDDDDYDAENPFGEDGAVVPAKELTPRSVRDQQEESRLQGKKRVRPVLMSVSAAPDKRPREQEAVQLSQESTQLDPMQAALKAAEKASAAIETAPSGSQSQATTSGKLSGGSPPADTTEGHRSKQHEKVHEVSLSVTATSKIPHDNSRVRSVDLPMPADHIHDPLEPEQVFYVAECANTIKVPTGSQGASIPCIDLVLKENSRVTWRDQIPGATCSALAASRSILAVGTSDGSLQLYGNSPTLGWKSGLSFRSHPPLVFGSCVVRLRLDYRQNEENEILELLVVTADGGFGVYTILPRLTLQYKGSLLPAMTHMALGASISGEASNLPKLSRIQITQFGHLFLLLSLADQSTNERNSARSSKKVGVGGSLQAFVYDRHSELWMRISDSRFVLSDFYSSLPSSRMTMSLGPLSQMDDSVKMGSLKSLLHSSHRNRSYETEAIYNQAEEPTGNYIASRSHCEDRMACAVALESSSEFKYWLVRYVRNLAVMGNASQLRMVVDMLLDSTNQSLLDSESSCWWLSSSPDLLQLERKGLVRDIVIKEMSKNRALQRLTNEISLELQSI